MVAAELELAVVEASRGGISSPVDRLLLLCYHYDPTTGKYNPAVMGFLRLGGIALVVAALPAYAAAKTSYYVSLGDSLSVGFQPHQGRAASTTRQGYVDDLFKIERRSAR